MTNSKHPTTIDGYPDLIKLAYTVGQLRYDALAEFIGLLATELDAQRTANEKQGRRQVAAYLKWVAEYLSQARNEAWRAWRESEPHVKEDE